MKQMRFGIRPPTAAAAPCAGPRAMDIVAGAGHGAVDVASAASTAMIFMPCSGRASGGAAA